jgi:hypothetical protein
VDEPSDKAPGGARGHRVILTKAAAEFKASVEAGAGGEWVHEVTEDQLFDAVKESGLV